MWPGISASLRICPGVKSVYHLAPKLVWGDEPMCKPSVYVYYLLNGARSEGTAVQRALYGDLLCLSIMREVEWTKGADAKGT